MAKITNEEAQEIWDNRITSCKCYSSEEKTAATYMGYRFLGELDDMQYYATTDNGDVTVTHSTSSSTIESSVIAYLVKQDKKPSPVMTETKV